MLLPCLFADESLCPPFPELCFPFYFSLIVCASNCRQTLRGGHFRVCWSFSDRDQIDQKGNRRNIFVLLFMFFHYSLQFMCVSIAIGFHSIVNSILKGNFILKVNESAPKSRSGCTHNLLG